MTLFRLDCVISADAMHCNRGKKKRITEFRQQKASEYKFEYGFAL